MRLIRVVFVCLFLTVPFFANAQAIYWTLEPDGGIRNDLKDKTNYRDHLEMSGQQISAIIRYGKDSLGRLYWSRKLVFPMLRMLPNDTRGSLVCELDRNVIDSVKINGKVYPEQPTAFYINGLLRTTSLAGPLRVCRTAFPSTDKCALIEQYQLTNTSREAVFVEIPGIDEDIVTRAEKTLSGPYVVNSRVSAEKIMIRPGDSYTFSLVISGRKKHENNYHFSSQFELDKRMRFLRGLQNTLILETPNDTIDRMFAFAKIRVTESIFDTKAGLMHAPGGGDYYAAIWANDQAEYVNPFFPFLGNAEATESARNSFRLFADYMNDEFRPIPSSIIAEGDSVWNGAGDRGDQAMIAYGASLFALYQGDIAEARELWKLVSWCLEFLNRKKTPGGVITSDSDELEGRFAAGKINLSTNVLAYAAFLHGSKLAACLGLQKEHDRLERSARDLRISIEKYFGAEVEGFRTYRYYEANTKLRSWICLPLVMGIFDRKDETIRALLSEKLWTKNGILTESNSTTYWDRSTLYAFRGMFSAGATDAVMNYFRYYSAMRLLGVHVPYAIEAWPEGDQRHLAAESGLYCRAITEGLFNINPRTFNSFTISPKMPRNWQQMALRHIRIFQRDFDIVVKRKQDAYLIEVLAGNHILQSLDWNGEGELLVKF